GLVRDWQRPGEAHVDGDVDLETAGRTVGVGVEQAQAVADPDRLDPVDRAGDVETRFGGPRAGAAHVEVVLEPATAALLDRRRQPPGRRGRDGDRGAGVGESRVETGRDLGRRRTRSSVIGDRYVTEPDADDVPGQRCGHKLVARGFRRRLQDLYRV